MAYCDYVSSNKKVWCTRQAKYSWWRGTKHRKTCVQHTPTKYSVPAYKIGGGK